MEVYCIEWQLTHHGQGVSQDTPLNLVSESTSIGIIPKVCQQINNLI